MNKQHEMVKDFHKKMEQPVGDKPHPLSYKRHQERFDLMAEELEEFFLAETLVDQVDALLDITYLVNGTFVEMGVKPEKPFEIVHKANMSKLWEDGKPRVNENGKVIKPPHFKKPEPELEKELERQANSY